MITNYSRQQFIGKKSVIYAIVNSFVKCKNYLPATGLEHFG